METMEGCLEVVPWVRGREPGGLHRLAAFR